MDDGTSFVSQDKSVQRRKLQAAAINKEKVLQTKPNPKVENQVQKSDSPKPFARYQWKPCLYLYSLHISTPSSAL